MERIFLKINFADKVKDEMMVLEGKKRLTHSSNVKLISTDGQRFPFSDNEFDFVFSFIVFQYMPNRETVRKNFEEIARVLKTNGIAKIQVRGLPTKKTNWFYGPSFDVRGIRTLLKNIPLEIRKTQGENQRYFWLWLEKSG